MKLFKLFLIFLCGLLLLTNSASALLLEDGTDIGNLDIVRSTASIKNSYPAELSWVQSVLGETYFFSEGDKYDVQETFWSSVADHSTYFALGLNGSPEYFFIKVGTGGTNIATTHWLYTNLASFNWVVVDIADWGIGKNIDITRISHIGEISGAPAPVPEPATVVLFGLGLLGLAAKCRKKFID